jgi:hypothetical protein
VNGEAGDVLAPEGNPEIVTATGLENPFCPVIDTAKVELGPPALTVSEDGDTPMLKSCAELTVKVSCAECVSAPEVPLIVKV